jgi:hypothetical protein
LLNSFSPMTPLTTTTSGAKGPPAPLLPILTTCRLGAPAARRRWEVQVSGIADLSAQACNGCFLNRHWHACGPAGSALAACSQFGWARVQIALHPPAAACACGQLCCSAAVPLRCVSKVVRWNWLPHAMLRAAATWLVLGRGLTRTPAAKWVLEPRQVCMLLLLLFDTGTPCCGR